MKRRMNPIRLRILVVSMLAFTALALGAMIVQLRLVQREVGAIRSSRSFARAQLVKLYVELRYEGDWWVAGHSLYRGKGLPPGTEELLKVLSAYLPPDSVVSYHEGRPPALGHADLPDFGGLPPGGPPESPPAGGPPSPEGAPPRSPWFHDDPFPIRGGSGIAVRSAAGEAIGWIGVATVEAERSRWGDRMALSLFGGGAVVVLAAVAALGGLVAWLSRPIDGMAEAHERAAARNLELASISCTDFLTGLLNRRGLEAALANDEAAGDPPSHLIMLDVDHFKAVNDLRGHDEGDRVLAAIGRLLSSGVRRGDESCRWGGEEFLVLLHGLDAEGSLSSAERIRASVEALALGTARDPFRVTATLGVAAFAGGFEAAVAAADEALYRGKRDGRNRVVSGA